MGFAMQEPNKIRDYLVEIWFPIEKDETGYPESKSWEQLLARPTNEIDQFTLESIPFYLKNVSRGDLVKAKVVKTDGEDAFHFDGVVARGGHNTYRLLLRSEKADGPELTKKELLAKGLFIEEEHGGTFLALDIPPSIDQQAIDQYLVSESESGRWEMQDGCLQTVNTHSP
jgi:hypothetical protein